MRRRCSASITTWASRPCRTCWSSASPMGCLSRCGIAITSTTCRSRWRRRSAWKGAVLIMKRPAGSEICIHFKPAPGVLFGAQQQNLQHNVLVLRVQPKEGISLLINAKTPGTVTRIAPAHMDFNYEVAFGSYSPEAYERLLLDAI